MAEVIASDFYGDRLDLSARSVAPDSTWSRMPEVECVTRLSDAELLQRAIAREDELQPTVRQLEQNVSELKLRASELERERDEARESASASRRPYQELESAYQKEVAAHKETNELFIAVRVTVFVLLALLIASVLVWWFVLR